MANHWWKSLTKRSKSYPTLPVPVPATAPAERMTEAELLSVIMQIGRDERSHDLILLAQGRNVELRPPTRAVEVVVENDGAEVNEIERVACLATNHNDHITKPNDLDVIVQENEPRALTVTQNSRPKILLLPQETFIQISLLLDRPTAISFSRAERHFTEAADYTIWRDINIFLRPTFGMLPLIQPYRTDSPAHDEWLCSQAMESEMRNRRGLKDKAMDILLQGTAARWIYVRTIKLVVRPGSAIPIISILDFASKRLESLEMVGPDRNIYDRLWRSRSESDILCVKLLECELYFPALTHIRLGEGSVKTASVITNLCLWAPNLDSLDIQLSDQISRYRERTAAILPRPTSITRLRISFYAPSTGTSGAYGVSDPPSEPLSTILLLLQQSHSLRQLTLNCAVSPRLATVVYRRLLSAIRGLEDLRDLHLPGIGHQALCLEGASWDWPVGGFLALRRLVVACDWVKLFGHWPALPNLEIIHFEHFPGDIDEPPEPDIFNPTAPMTPLFARQVRDTPKLTVLNSIAKVDTNVWDLFDRLDEIEAKGVFTGHVRSLHHGQQQLLHVRLLTRFARHSDVPWSLAPTIFPHGPNTRQYRLNYTSSNGSPRAVILDRQDIASWWEYTEYQGFMVPAEIIWRMKMADGAGETDWQGRRIEVGDAGWRVLQEWKNGILAAVLNF